MNIDRPMFVSGLAALAAATPCRGTPFYVASAPVRFSYDADPFLDMRVVSKVSDWSYQTINPARADLRGIVWRLPTGFGFLAELEDEPGAEPRFEMHMAYCLFRTGEFAITSECVHIARAAGYVAGGVETAADGGSFYAQRDRFDAREVPAPPFIAAEAPNAFMLYV